MKTIIKFIIAIVIIYLLTLAYAQHINSRYAKYQERAEVTQLNLTTIL